MNGEKLERQLGCGVDEWVIPSTLMLCVVKYFDTHEVMNKI
jgi:hypothetical protein